MGYGRPGRRKGFTLIELLVVIVIISIIMALLLPALAKALCNGRAGATAGLISQLAQAAKMYEGDYAVYPPGTGSGSKDLASYLELKGPKKLPYFEFQLDMRDTGADIINPVFGEGADVFNKLHYRNNISGTGAGGAQGGAMPVYKKSSFDLWAAGCDYTQANTQSQWSLKYE